MSTWNDFNDAEQQQSFDLIPKGTVARVRMTIKPGAFDDPAQGWNGGYATQSFETGSVYLSCEFVILEGEFARRKMWSNIGLHSPKGPNSARNIRPQDNSPQAAAARRIAGFHELDGLEFVARIDVEKDGHGELKNVVKLAVEPDHPDYARGNGASSATRAPTRPTAASLAPQAPMAAHAAATPAQRPTAPGKPAWAQ
jgi:hypothetical protein